MYSDDKEVLEIPHNILNQLIEINLDELEPHINGPFTPDLAWPISKWRSNKRKGYPEKMSVGSSAAAQIPAMKIIDRSASIARQALAKNLRVKANLISHQVRNSSGNHWESGQLHLLRLSAA